jgi:hypothetical protein
MENEATRYTAQEQAEFRQQFAARRTRQIIVSIPLVALIVAFAAFTDDKSGGTLLGLPLAVGGPVFLVLIVAAIVFSLRNWRCPACNRYLGKAINPRFCQKCGVALQ